MCGGDGVLFEFSPGDAVFVNFFCVVVVLRTPHAPHPHYDKTFVTRCYALSSIRKNGKFAGCS